MNREENIRRLEREAFDLCVVGGGATGAGIALDAASRGLRTALVERGDLSSGSSSRSTKLLHGGVRYLERAVKELDRGQLELVMDALGERRTLLRLAPHLARRLEIVTPLHGAFEAPYMLAGLTLYDKLSGRSSLGGSRYLSRHAALRRFPALRREGLSGAVLYRDGQFDDARMNVEIALAADRLGAAVANHVEAVGLTKAPEILPAARGSPSNAPGAPSPGSSRGAPRIDGVEVRDRLSGARIRVRAKAVVNAAGPYCDALRRLDDPSCTPMLTTSSGAHVVLPPRFVPEGTGLLVPRTEDGRVLFLLPFLGHALAGTTDVPAPLEDEPRAHASDVAYILRQLARHVSMPVSDADVLSTWSGLRPLVAAPGAGSTARLSRDHVIQESPSGLVTITGGKWTTYRIMAREAVDAAVRAGSLEPVRPSQTERISLPGGLGFESRERFAALRGETPAGIIARDSGLCADVARHLWRTYGVRAQEVAALARAEGAAARLAPGHPFIEAEVLFAALEEGARTSADVLARRLRLAFLDLRAAGAALPRVRARLAAALGWDAAQREADAANGLPGFGVGLASAASGEVGNRLPVATSPSLVGAGSGPGSRP